MNIFRQFTNFTLRILRQTILYILLALDLIGLVITYNSRIQLPTWLLTIIPIVAIFLAGFNIYRQGTADIRIDLIEEEDPQYYCNNLKGDRQYNFRGKINGHLFNFGSQSGVLETISYKVGFNDIFNEFVISRMFLACNVSPLLAGKVDPSDNNYVDKKIELPLVLKSSDILPFTLILDIRILVTPNEEFIWQVLDWLKFINLQITYTARQSDGIVTQEIKTNLSTQLMMDAAISSEGGIQTFEIEKSLF